MMASKNGDLLARQLRWNKMVTADGSSVTA